MLPTPSHLPIANLSTTSVIILSTVILYCLKTFFSYRSAVRSTGNLPGWHTFIGSFGLVGFLFKKPRGKLIGGSLRAWYRKHLDFQEAGQDIINHIYFVPFVYQEVVVADAAVIKEITSQRAKFPKPPYNELRLYGGNIIASEGDEWKRHRKVSAPAFSERNNRLVWEETVKIMTDLFDNVWGEKEKVVYDNALDMTLPIALFVIAVAGFGRNVSWQSDLVAPSGHKLAFKDALRVVSRDLYTKIVTPKWLFHLAPTKHIAEVKLGCEELEKYMAEMIEDRRAAEKKEERYDLFSSLLDASDAESDGAVKLTDNELLGNIFIFLLAGHETTAHTLCFTFGLLALHQDAQEKLYQHIKSIVPDDRPPTYEEMHLLTESMAVFYESLRMFPPVLGVPKLSTEDTTLATSDHAGKKVVVPIPKGMVVGINICGVHYNPRYWEDPYTFKPSRFHGDWPREAFLPFSAGARACLGRRFFETEGIAILTMLVSRYKIDLKDDPEFAGATLEEIQEILFEIRQGITIAPARVPLVFTRRQ
ncbi:hypothetical protein PHLGIDRAFT_515467 [Phlebiopsis gigantea 11061_1 CR5-6]|uniref:Cytochrome P450 n=1 Tax=Phlebiopsis gigantea (strain 11061_1 CR5-6) TaxID=745531 RepID=A0A0C3NMV3_PHLG1|nr:hypothetical protein PHLGIDRAFT_515467 [Phlebiopsis gigantea 11061_1 CR5-6]